MELVNIALLKLESIVNNEIKTNNKINTEIIMYLQTLLNIGYLFLRINNLRHFLQQLLLLRLLHQF